MKTHQQFASVKGQFLDKWLKHEDPANNSPRVERIFEVRALLHPEVLPLLLTAVLLAHILQKR
jgi:hypothetical protein